MKSFSHSTWILSIAGLIAACQPKQYAQQGEYDDMYRTSTYPKIESGQITTQTSSNTYTENTIADDYYGSSAKTVNPEYIESYQNSAAGNLQTNDSYSSEAYYEDNYESTAKNVTINNYYNEGYGCSSCVYRPNTYASTRYSSYWGWGSHVSWNVGYANVYSPYNTYCSSGYYDPFYYRQYVYHDPYSPVYYYRAPYYAYSPYRYGYYKGYHHGYHDSKHYAVTSPSNSDINYGPRGSRSATVGVNRYSGQRSSTQNRQVTNSRYEGIRRQNNTSGSKTVNQDSRDHTISQEEYVQKSRKSRTNAPRVTTNTSTGKSTSANQSATSRNKTNDHNTNASGSQTETSRKSRTNSPRVTTNTSTRKPASVNQPATSRTRKNDYNTNTSGSRNQNNNSAINSSRNKSNTSSGHSSTRVNSTGKSRKGR